jgi:hypothetical protein
MPPRDEYVRIPQRARVRSCMRQKEQVRPQARRARVRLDSRWRSGSFGIRGQDAYTSVPGPRDLAPWMKRGSAGAPSARGLLMGPSRCLEQNGSTSLHDHRNSRQPVVSSSRSSRSVVKSALTIPSLVFCSVGPCDRGNPCPRPAGPLRCGVPRTGARPTDGYIKALSLPRQPMWPASTEGDPESKRAIPRHRSTRRGGSGGWMRLPERGCRQRLLTPTVRRPRRRISWHAFESGERVDGVAAVCP